MTRGMIFKGTPGPWTCVRNMGMDIFKGKFEHGSDDDLMGFVGAGGGKVCWFGNRANYYPTEGEEPNEYDAQIIAAAPELLEALKPFAECCNSLDPEISDSKDISYWTFQAGDFRRALAAIAKALGEEE